MIHFLKYYYSLLLIVLVTLISSCDKEYPIKFTTVDYFTGEIIPNYEMSFDVPYGSGSSGGISKAKYNGISDNNGFCTILIERSDRKESLYLGYSTLPEGSDSTNKNWKYIKSDEGNEKISYPVSILKVKPSGRILVRHPYYYDKSTSIDTVEVAVNYQILTFSANVENIQQMLYLIPNETYDIQFSYIKKGVKYLTKIISYTVPTAYNGGFGTIDFKIPEI